MWDGFVHGFGYGRRGDGVGVADEDGGGDGDGGAAVAIVRAVAHGAQGVFDGLGGAGFHDGGDLLDELGTVLLRFAGEHFGEHGGGDGFGAAGADGFDHFVSAGFAVGGVGFGFGVDE